MADECSTCEGQFLYSSVGNYCEAVVGTFNCAEFKTHQQSDPNLRCLTCDAGFLLNIDELCIPIPSVNDCATDAYGLVNNEAKCVECTFNFYLDDDNLCVARTNPELCEEYENFSSNVCVRCISNSKVVNDSGICEDLAVYHANCDSYANTNDCD